MKRLFILIAFLIVMCIVAVYCIFFRSSKYINTRLSGINYVEENCVCKINEKYYYALNDGVYCDSNCKLHTPTKPLIFSRRNALFAYYDKTIYEYDKTFTLCSTYDMNKDINCFFVSDNEIVFFDENDQYYVVDKKNLSTKSAKEIKTIDEIEIEYYDELIVCCDKREYKTAGNNKNISVSVMCGGKLVLKKYKGYARHILSINDEQIVYTSSTNTNTIDLFIRSLSDMDKSTLRLPTNYYIISARKDNDSIVFICSKNPIDPHLEYENYSVLKNHSSDCIFIVDLNKKDTVCENYTDRFERIIYANKNKYLTFKNGKYTLYDTSNGNKVNSLKSNAIQPSKDYSFTSYENGCLVFDHVSGELIDVIEV